METLVVEPIGFVRNELQTRVEAPRQPRTGGAVPARIELLPGHHYEHAIEELDQWELIWVIFWFHLNEAWRPKVLPPRSTSGRKGVFSTRSPHRPNPLGMSVVRLERIEGLTLHLHDTDMLDGTPVLDVKPYVAYTDAHPDAGTGWLQNGGSGAPIDPVSPYTVRFAPAAAQQAAWVETRTGLKLTERIQATLSLGPVPHPYRRIKSTPHGMQLAIKEWRALFTVRDRDVLVAQVCSGYRASQLASGSADPGLLAHREFMAAWPSDP